MSSTLHASSGSLHFGQALLPEGWVDNVRISFAAGRISEVARNVSPDGRDQQHAVALPGIPNLHSHAFQRAMAGLTERRDAGDDNFWTWRQAMYRFVDRIDPEALEAVAALAYLEMLERGFTRVGEFHYLHHDRNGVAYADPAEMAGAIVRAAEATGIGLTLLPVLYAQAGFGGGALESAQRRFACGIDGFARLLEACSARVRTLRDGVLGVAPHSLRAVAPEMLSAVVAMNDGPIHIHIAEQVKEVDDCVAWSGLRPVEWLLAHQEVGERWCLVHATHMSDVETRALARSGAVAGLCPITEANLGDGLFPARLYAQCGGAFGVGSDSNVLIDAREELRLLEYGQRLQLRERNVLAQPSQSVGVALVSGAVLGGGRALGDRAGIAPGASADIVSLAQDDAALTARRGDAIADSYVFAHAGVDCVWRAGDQVVRGGKHRARDVVTARYRSTMKRLLA